MFVTNWISTTKIQKISEITNFFRHYFLSRTEVKFKTFLYSPKENDKKFGVFEKKHYLCHHQKDKMNNETT